MKTLLEPEIRQERTGKYLTFQLGGESYGVAVLKVREIIKMQTPTALPQLPDYIKGIINLRGKIIPVVDLRIKFALSDPKITESTCIIVVDHKIKAETKQLTGMIVDAVEDVTNITESDMEPAPEFGHSLHTDFILGIAKIKGTVKTLLDIDQIIDADEVHAVVKNK